MALLSKQLADDASLMESESREKRLFGFGLYVRDVCNTIPAMTKEEKSWSLRLIRFYADTATKEKWDNDEKQLFIGRIQHLRQNDWINQFTGEADKRMLDGLILSYAENDPSAEVRTKAKRTLYDITIRDAAQSCDEESRNAFAAELQEFEKEAMTYKQKDPKNIHVLTEMAYLYCQERQRRFIRNPMAA